MTSLVDAVIGAAPPGTRVELRLGSVQSVNYTTQMMVVKIDDVNLPVRMASDVPRLQSNVWVLIVGQLAIAVGQPVRAPMGTVTGTPANGLVDVLVDDGITSTVGFATSYTPAAQHRVLLDWRAGGHILIRTDPAAAQPSPEVPPPTNPGTPVVSKSRTFYASDSASHRRGGAWQSGSVYFGQSFDSSGYFYGTQIADTIPDGATITGVRVYLEVLQASGVATMPLSLHASAGRSGGGLALDQTVDIGSMPAGFRGDVQLPAGWGDLLKTGARLGIGTSGAGLRVLKGSSANAACGAMTLDWKE